MRVANCGHLLLYVYPLLVLAPFLLRSSALLPRCDLRCLSHRRRGLASCGSSLWDCCQWSWLRQRHANRAAGLICRNSHSLHSLACPVHNLTEIMDLLRKLSELRLPRRWRSTWNKLNRISYGRLARCNRPQRRWHPDFHRTRLLDNLAKIMHLIRQLAELILWDRLRVGGERLSPGQSVNALLCCSFDGLQKLLHLGDRRRRKVDAASWARTRKAGSRACTSVGIGCLGEFLKSQAPIRHTRRIWNAADRAAFW
mmetsp:Transcript_114353/g.243908  ORF Transcript_114353/g.243908 Transcript_114353/m.243908 type:complete len:255 (+) Transcript_114353:666-1430(+)